MEVMKGFPTLFSDKKVGQLALFRSHPEHLTKDLNLIKGTSFFFEKKNGVGLPKLFTTLFAVMLTEF